MNYRFRPQLMEEAKSYASHTPEAKDDILDCSLGENPYGFPAGAPEALRTFDTNLLSRYPHSGLLSDAVIRFWKGYALLLPENLRAVAGTVEGLYDLNDLFSGTGRDRVVGFLPTFTNMVVNVEHSGLTYCGVPMDFAAGGKEDAAGILEAIDGRTAFVYIDRPNNPTGQVLSLADVEAVLRRAEDAGCYAVIDEAYGDFIPREESALTLWGKYENLIVLRTFSKGFGLADLRGGYIAAPKEIIDILIRMGHPYNIGELGKRVFAAALQDPSHPMAHADYFARAKEEMRAAAGEAVSMLVTDPRVPLCTLELERPGDLQALLYEQGILTVSGVEFELLDERFVRLRIPVEAELPRLLAALRTLAQG